MHFNFCTKNTDIEFLPICIFLIDSLVTDPPPCEPNFTRRSKYTPAKPLEKLAMKTLMSPKKRDPLFLADSWASLLDESFGIWKI